MFSCFFFHLCGVYVLNCVGWGVQSNPVRYRHNLPRVVTW